jgi:hypothetical protein
MSDDFGGDSGESEIPDDEYGEGGIPPDMEADIEERVQREVDERAGDLYDDSQPRSSGCLLILALPALALWFLR